MKSYFPKDFLWGEQQLPTKLKEALGSMEKACRFLMSICSIPQCRKNVGLTNGI